MLQWQEVIRLMDTNIHRVITVATMASLIWVMKLSTTVVDFLLVIPNHFRSTLKSESLYQTLVIFLFFEDSDTSKQFKRDVINDIFDFEYLLNSSLYKISSFYLFLISLICLRLVRTSVQLWEWFYTWA